jgi:hypothetical protein
MALNTWWDGDGDQRYWIEMATGRVGTLLKAPKSDTAHWSYELVSKVEPGDRVLHYKTGASGGAAFVGWSEAVESAVTIPTYTWRARGAAGRSRGTPTTGPGWQVRLGGLHPFRKELTRDRMAPRLDELMALRDKLEHDHGVPIYFPFYRYGTNQLRAQQGYLAKFPVELFDVLPELTAARLVATVTDEAESETVEDGCSPGAMAPRGSVTRAQDPVLRAAIECHAVESAKAYYRGLGVSEDDIEELGKPYDLRVKLTGAERHVEVKGSSQLIDTVALTRNEVRHADRFTRTDLIVVDGIMWRREPDGRVSTTGGRRRVWSAWRPQRQSLTPLTFAYQLPADPSAR